MLSIDYQHTPSKQPNAQKFWWITSILTASSTKTMARAEGKDPTRHAWTLPASLREIGRGDKPLVEYINCTCDELWCLRTQSRAYLTIQNCDPWPVEHRNTSLKMMISNSMTQIPLLTGLTLDCIHWSWYTRQRRFSSNSRQRCAHRTEEQAIAIRQLLDLSAEDEDELEYRLWPLAAFYSCVTQRVYGSMALRYNRSPSKAPPCRQNWVVYLDER